MASLYKRATPAQEKVFRIVEGAVFNTADAHGDERDPWIARSIAKRVAGTLTAQWPEVLAVRSRLPETGAVSGVTKCRACERRAHVLRLRARQQAVLTGGHAGRRASQLLRRPPLRELWLRLKREMWHLTRSENTARVEAYRDVLRAIDKLEREIADALDLGRAAMPPHNGEPK